MSFYPTKSSGDLVSYLRRTTEIFHHMQPEGKDKESPEFLGWQFKPPHPSFLSVFTNAHLILLSNKQMRESVSLLKIWFFLL